MWFNTTHIWFNMTNCPKCGLSLALVGRNHRCRSNPEKPEQISAAGAGTRPAKSSADALEKIPSTTYQYRDPEKRRSYLREYMREYMRRRRSG